MADAAELIIRIRDDGRPAQQPAAPAGPRPTQSPDDRLFEPERPRQAPVGNRPVQSPGPVAPPPPQSEYRPVGLPEPLRPMERRQPELDELFDPTPVSERPAVKPVGIDDQLTAALREFDPEAADDIREVMRAFAEGRSQIERAAPPPLPTSPPPTPQPVGQPASGLDEWAERHGERYRELRNRADMGGRLVGDEPQELDRLEGEFRERVAEPPRPKQQRPTTPETGQPAPTDDRIPLAEGSPTYQIAPEPRPRPEQQRFRYEALDHDGRDVGGTVTAADEDEARRKIVAQKRFVTKMTPVPRAKPVGERPDDGPIPLAGSMPEGYKLGPSGRPVATPVGPQEEGPGRADAEKLSPREQAVARERARMEGRGIPRAVPVDPAGAAADSVKRREAENNARAMMYVLPPWMRAGLGAAGDAAGTLGKVAGAGSSGLAGASAAVGGPVGLAMVAADVAAKGFQKVGQAAEAVGAGMSQLADNDHLGMLRTGVDTAANTLEAVPVAGKPFAEALRLGTRAVGAYSEAVNSFVQRGRELSQYNSQLAGAVAGSDIRNLFADLREANRLAPSLSRLIDAQSRASTAIRDAMLPIKEVFAGMLAKQLDGLANFLDRNESNIKATTDLGLRMVEGQIATASYAIKNGYWLSQAVDYLGDLVGFAKDDKRRKEVDYLAEMNDRINNLGQGMPNMPAPVDHAAQAGKQALGAPILGLN